MFWRCVERGCQAFLSKFNDIPTGFGRQNHNHPAYHSNVVAEQIMSKISRRCAEEIRPIPTIFTEELTKLRDNEWDDSCREVVEKIPTFNSTKSMLYRARIKQTHPIPKTKTDIFLDAKWTETATGDRFLLFDDGDQNNRMLAFATTRDT